MIRPSSLPALAECPCFESGSSDFADEGTQRHEALKAHFEGNDLLLNALPDEERDAVKWAADYIRLKSHSEHPIIVERTLTATLPNFDEITGTPDAACYLDIFDLKWRERDYTTQMAAYAFLHLSEIGHEGPVTIHILFGAFHRVETLKVDMDSAVRTIMPIIERATAKDRQPAPCTYCGWCSARLTCKALNERAQAVAAGREDWQLEQYHASAILDPVEMGKALALAKHLSKWIDGVEHHAKEMAVKQGVTIPGWTLKTKAGKRSTFDMAGAFNATGLPSEQFLACCEIRLTTDKKNPSKVGLENLYAEQQGISKAAAARELKKKLEPFTRTPKETQYLAPEKPEPTDEKESE
jgi:hypothetical protein